MTMVMHGLKLMEKWSANPISAVILDQMKIAERLLG